MGGEARPVGEVGPGTVAPDSVDRIADPDIGSLAPTVVVRGLARADIADETAFGSTAH
jgi:hypothetical protein